MKMTENKLFTKFCAAIASFGLASGMVVQAPSYAQTQGIYNPRDVIIVNGILYFTAYNPTTGYELYRSNGTAAGTVLVKDINPGTDDSFPRNLTNVNGTLYFTAYNPATGYELYRSNGTAAGTVLVKDIYLGSSDSSPNDLTNVNGTLYFTAYNPVTGYELYRSNGTAAGTVLVKDIVPGPNSSIPDNLTNVNGTLYFTADNPLTGYELYKSNGTAAGTLLVKDIYPGYINTFANDSSPRNLTNVNGTLFFTAFNPLTGYELYKSNGTAAGTVLVKDIYPGSDSSLGFFGDGNLTNVNGTLYFTAYNPATGEELYKSNGTAAGTILVKDINPGFAGSFPLNLTNVNGTLYFIADNPTTGRELYKSNGTAAGTVLVKDILLGADSSFTFTGSTADYHLTNVNGTLYFTAYNPATGYELYKSNGTAATTGLVKDIYPGAFGSSPNYLTGIGSTLYFSATGLNYNKLWRSNGTAVGTVQVTP